MKFKVHRDQFVQGVQHVAKSISQRTTIPILTGMKLEASAEGVTLTGSDSDISIEYFIPKEDEEHQYVEVFEEGSIVLQAKYFTEIVKKLPKETVEISVQDQFATTVMSGSAVFNLNGLDPEEYPRLPQVEEDKTFQIPKDLLKNLIRQTVFATSNAETRPILTGVHWQLNDEQLTCSATDSHRLAMRKAKINTNSSGLSFSNVVIPGKSLSELSKVLNDSDELVDVVVSENQILFKADHFLFFSRLLEGNYPATENMIPTEAKTSVILQSKRFLSAIERSMLLSEDNKNNVVNLKTIGNGMLEITSVTPEVGKATEEVTSEEMSGEDLRISFNGKNLIDALKVVDSEEVKIDFTGAMSPFVLKPTDHDHSLHLFSPVRTY
ncbi:DNA polymerase III subunit beta [Texcoconibacillus texcoconensis]|uniref:Beta sliding clamp n=1 Tax=Texcoconibacillus texcoconensis TaxID=1095777 RepID=A0A840QTT1_9BACI|nr:DNA polymerase III subunit beta [Texcoconibacillus texcoconensis]MBB5174785.1 DNA polymerase-3 subunit beta [Texcoconibacillus texcoconensis]